jgi:predicted ester cyclase
VPANNKLTNDTLQSAVVDRAWNRGELDAIDEAVHPDYVRHTSQGDVVGREGFKARITMMRAAFPDLHSTVEERLVDGDRQAARFTVTGTHRGDFFGIAPTNARVKFQNAVIFHLRDGLLFEEWEFADSAAILAQLHA